jgi:hypothetical protein
MTRSWVPLAAVLLFACHAEDDKPAGDKKPVAPPSGGVEHAATGRFVRDPGPAPASLPQAAREAFEKMMPVYDEYAAAATGNAGSCSKVTAAIREVTSRRAAEIAAWKEYRGQIDGDIAAVDWFKRAYLPRFDAAVEAMRPAMLPCLSSSAEMAAAISEAPLPQTW